jgi:hypothetical protein
MTAYVEECRQEWRRLGVPDLLAEEMATELETDLAEAEADGVSAAEMLGESDPRRFAASWARERGLVREEQPPQTSQRRRWGVWLAVGAVVLFFVLAFVAWTALQSVSVSTATIQSPKPVRSVVIPNFIGLRACHAKRIASESGLKIRRFPNRRCNSVVIAQRPAPHTLLA